MEWDGGQKCPSLPALIFFFKYLQNIPWISFKYLKYLVWLLAITYFEFFCWISRENFDWLTSYCDFVRGVLKNLKKFFFSKKDFFLIQHFLQNISSIHYAEVVNMIFFIWNHIVSLVFENKYIRIGNFVAFLSEGMELTSESFLYLHCKTICFYLFIFFFL